jgi:hypothetical protein
MAIVPRTPSRSALGVMIGFEGEGKGTVIAPDEARTIALEIEGSDPGVAAEMRKYADEVESCVRGEKSSHFPPGGLEIVGPKLTGPEALRDWSQRYRKHFQAAYRKAGQGQVLLATPRTQSLDDAPAVFSFCGLDVANAIIQAIALPPNRAAGRGRFLLVSTCEQGRFQGTFVGELPIAPADAVLPEVDVKPVPVFSREDWLSRN